MRDLIFITSIIDIPDKPLNYTNVRSIYTREERYEQTKRTIDSIRMNMRMDERELKIMIIECSNFGKDEDGKKMEKYLKENTDYYLNLWDRIELHNYIFGLSKSLGEMKLINEVIEYIKDNKLEFENIYKLSGRYEVLNTINMDKYWNNMNIFYYYPESNIVSTVLYKIRYENIDEFQEFINKSWELCNNYVGTEVIFMGYVNLVKKKDEKKIYLLTKELDVTGNIAVDGNKLI